MTWWPSCLGRALANLGTMLALGFGGVLLGGALLLSRRRFGAR